MSGPVVQRDRLLSLFRDMVDVYSPSGKEEELTALLSCFLRAQGVRVEEQRVDETRCNLLAGAIDGDPETLFLGHIDTVPAFDIEQAGFSESDGVCRGLGTADMKGGCAALIEAFVAAAQDDVLPDSVLLALVVGEEESGDGTQALLQTRSFSQALVAEPTDLQVCLSHYGYVEMCIRAFGSRRHAAMSGRDTNAIRAMLRFLLQLEDRIEREEPETVLNIRDLHSSESGFAVPDRCDASVDLHIPPRMKAAEYAAAVAEFTGQQLAATGASRCEVEFPTQADGYTVEPRSPLVDSLRGALDASGLGWKPSAFKSHSDANLLKQAGCTPILFGPGQLAKAHTSDESVDFVQVEDAAHVIARLLAGLRG